MALPGSAAPNVRALATTNPRTTSFIRYFGSERGAPAGEVPEWTPLAGIAPVLVAAAVKSEDGRFFEHRGVDWQATARSALDLVRGRPGGGASTITQQLARNLYLTPSRSMRRKLREIRLALAIERAVSKPRILELYLNLIEFGPGLWGCAAASRHHFGKAPCDLDLFESTFLVALLPAPKAGLSGRHAARCFWRQSLLAHQLFFSGVEGSEACVRCCARVRRLHRLLAQGAGLPVALSFSARVEGGANAARLQTLAAELDIVRIPHSDVLASHCGREQERIVTARLCARFGENAVWQMLTT